MLSAGLPAASPNVLVPLEFGAYVVRLGVEEPNNESKLLSKIVLDSLERSSGYSSGSLTMSDS